MKTNHVILCIPSDWIVEPLLPSGKRTCEHCGQAVWISHAERDDFADQGLYLRFLCAPCGEAALPDRDDAKRIDPRTLPRTKAALVRSNRKEN